MRPSSTQNTVVVTQLQGSSPLQHAASVQHPAPSTCFASALLTASLARKRAGVPTSLSSSQAARRCRSRRRGWHTRGVGDLGEALRMSRSRWSSSKCDAAARVAHPASVIWVLPRSSSLSCFSPPAAVQPVAAACLQAAVAPRGCVITSRVRNHLKPARQV